MESVKAAGTTACTEAFDADCVAQTPWFRGLNDFPDGIESVEPPEAAMLAEAFNGGRVSPAP